MKHTYSEHELRRVTDLNGTWRCLQDPENIGERQSWQQGLPENAYPQEVPSVWNSVPGLFSYRGAVWYERRFIGGGHILLEFLGVTGNAKVFLDGESIAEHYGSFTAFTAEVFTFTGEHRLIVLSDMTFTDDSVPKLMTDWYHYGGIIRDVLLHELPEPWIESVQYDYELNDTLTEARVTAKAVLHSNCDTVCPLTWELEGKEVFSSAETLSEGLNTLILGPVTVSSVRLWDIGKGELYTTSVRTAEDDLIDRIGFRRIEVCGQKLLLNGKSVRIKGVNRHEEHPDWGFAVPAQLNRRDISILKNMNVNAVRGSHYPNSRAFVDMLDEEGLLFWSEIPMWGFSREELSRELAVSRGLTMHEEMAAQYYNHPSVVIYGLNNEVDTTCPEGRAVLEKYAACLREKGGPRLITYATMRFADDICFDLADFVSVNEYHGWYIGSADDWAKVIPAYRTRLIESGNDKPLVISEFGAAAIYGNKNFDANKWTEEYQADLIEKVIRLAEKEPGVIGTYVWQYADIRSENNLNRARSYNNKGLVNEYRRPKLSYYTVQRLYGE